MFKSCVMEFLITVCYYFLLPYIYKAIHSSFSDKTRNHLKQRIKNIINSDTNNYKASRQIIVSLYLLRGVTNCIVTAKSDKAVCGAFEHSVHSVWEKSTIPISCIWNVLLWYTPIICCGCKDSYFEKNIYLIKN